MSDDSFRCPYCGTRATELEARTRELDDLKEKLGWTNEGVKSLQKRVQELSDAITQWKIEEEVWKETEKRLAAENQRLRESLERVIKLCDEWCDLGGDIPYNEIVPAVRAMIDKESGDE